jgi:hypothetical protein
MEAHLRIIMIELYEDLAIFQRRKLQGFEITFMNPLWDTLTYIYVNLCRLYRLR